MSIRARFYVRRIIKDAVGSGYAQPAPMAQVILNVVSGSKGEANKVWASSTPQGEITLTIGNPVAAAWFEERLGKDIAITFEDRPEDELAVG